MIRNAAKMHDADIFPTLHCLMVEKRQCYPADCVITEMSGKCSLQNMLDHTLSRLSDSGCLSIPNDIPAESTAELHVKADYDGASSQSIYNKKFETTSINSASKNEESLLQTSMVPLKLTVENKTIWQNVKPSSSRLCRPLHIQF